MKTLSKAIFQVVGFGSRLLPPTKSLPKRRYLRVLIDYQFNMRSMKLSAGIDMLNIRQRAQQMTLPKTLMFIRWESDEFTCCIPAGQFVRPPFHGECYDCVNKFGFQESNLHFGLKEGHI